MWAGRLPGTTLSAALSKSSSRRALLNRTCAEKAAKDINPRPIYVGSSKRRGVYFLVNPLVGFVMLLKSFLGVNVQKHGSKF